MSTRTEEGRAVTRSLIHYGVKGMKWGVSRKRSSRVTVTARGSKPLKAKGGENRKPSSDAMTFKRIGQQAKKSGYQSLSTAELKAYVERKALEARAHDLDNAHLRAGAKFVEDFLKSK